MNKIRACEVSDLENASVLQVHRTGGDPLAVYCIDGSYFATDDLCTHGEAYLSEGDIEDGNIVCPYHGGTFDIATGNPTAAPCVVPIRTYPVSVDGGAVYIHIGAGD